MLDTDKIIFIGGSGRCGTTLMAELLDAHPAISSLFEVPMLVTMINQWQEGRLSKKVFLDKVYWETDFCMNPENEFNWRMLPEELRLSLDIFLHQIQSGQAYPQAILEWVNNIHVVQMIRDGGMRIAHKTPALAMLTKVIFQLWPHAYFIHMIRNPIDVVASYLNQDFGPDNIDEGIDWYCKRVGKAIQDGRGHVNYIEIRMEDLVERPAETLTDLQKLIGVVPATACILAEMPVDREKITNSGSAFDKETQAYIYKEVCAKVPAIAMLYRM